jgi:hypothetical protein
MYNKKKVELFEQYFGEKPTDSKTDKFLMGVILGIHNKQESKPDTRNYKKATIEEVVGHYSKSA